MSQADLWHTLNEYAGLLYFTKKNLAQIMYTAGNT